MNCVHFSVIRLAVLVLTGLLLSPGNLRALSQENPVRAELIYDSVKFSKENPGRIGVRFFIPSPWHIYWKYPGTTGLPTAIQFRVDGRELSTQLQWPLPKDFEQPGTIKGIGYEDEVVLYTNLAPDVPLAPKEIEARVRWLSCSPTLCIPGSASLKKNVSDDETEEHRAVLGEAAGKTPRELSATATSARVEYVSSNKMEITWDISSLPETVRHCTRWFPDPPEGFEFKEYRMIDKETLRGQVLVVPPLSKGSGPVSFPSLLSCVFTDGAVGGVWLPLTATL